MIYNFLIPGILIGLTAGISPGPLMALVISETLRHGVKSGIKVSLAPLITDVPIVLATLALFQHLKGNPVFFGIISVSGGLFLIYLGIKNWKTDLEHIQEPGGERSLQRAIIANFLSPHPYLFWITVGGSILGRVSFAEGAVFIIVFYSMLVGSKICIAIITDRVRWFLESRSYLWLIRGLGIALGIFGVILIKNGLDYVL